MTGAATAYNLVGNFYRYNVSRTPAEADCRAIRSDFEMVGKDLREAQSNPHAQEQMVLELS